MLVSLLSLGDCVGSRRGLGCRCPWLYQTMIFLIKSNENTSNQTKIASRYCGKSLSYRKELYNTILHYHSNHPMITSWADKNSLRCYLETASQTFLTTFSIILATLINGLPQHSKHDHLFTAITDERRQQPPLWLSTSLPIPAANPITVQYYSRKKKSPQLVLQIYN